VLRLGWFYCWTAYISFVSTCNIEYGEKEDKIMGKYDDVERHLITHCDELFPFASMDQARDWTKIEEMLSKIPYKCERLMTSEEILGFYE